MSSSAKTVAEYLTGLPGERRKALETVRKVIRRSLPTGYVESMQHGMISYTVPLRRFSNTYNGAPLAYASLASQKNHMAVYLMGIYGDEALRGWFEREYRETGKRMDVGRCCVRFKKVEDLPLDLVGEAVAAVSLENFLAMHERAHGGARRPRR